MTKNLKLRFNFIIIIFFISIFFIETYLFNNLNKKDFNQNSYNFIFEEAKESNNSKQIKEYVVENEKNIETIYKNDNIDNYDWQIEIPSISLKAEIKEGTEKAIMDKYVGHFTETSLTDGNVSLAAHNRGYAVNYFSNIKKLTEGDEIIYKYNDFEKTYLVVENTIIKDEDWSYLEETEDNRITLITCVENEPEYRRCIQGIEKN